MLKLQKYVLKDQDSFELKHIFDCGQCFRWNEQNDNSYTGVIKQGVINVKKTENIISFEGVLDGNIEEIITEYFDLKTDYKEIKKELSKTDKNLKKAIEYGKGIRILNQDLWETIISFIISANNNIPRIKSIIEKMSKKYGNKIEWKEKNYFSFPTAKQLENVSIQEFRELGAGFRDVRLYETTNMILKKEIDLNKLHEEKSTEKIKNELLTLSGVGPKVADCILLFSTLKRFDVFPIDVWVRRIMNELYIKNNNENKVSRKEIEKIAKNKFGNMQGLAQQYLFYWIRNGER